MCSQAIYMLKKWPMDKRLTLSTWENTTKWVELACRRTVRRSRTTFVDEADVDPCCGGGKGGVVADEAQALCPE